MIFFKYVRRIRQTLEREKTSNVHGLVDLILHKWPSYQNQIIETTQPRSKSPCHSSHKQKTKILEFKGDTKDFR